MGKKQENTIKEYIKNNLRINAAGTQLELWLGDEKISETEIFAVQHMPSPPFPSVIPLNDPPPIDVTPHVTCSRCGCGGGYHADYCSEKYKR